MNSQSLYCFQYPGQANILRGRRGACPTHSRFGSLLNPCLDVIACAFRASKSARISGRMQVSFRQNWLLRFSEAYEKITYPHSVSEAYFEADATLDRQVAKKSVLYS